MSTAAIPNRVAFVNIKDGSVFFDCHPSEARQAMEVINRVREGKEVDDTSKRILKSTEMALSGQGEPVAVTVSGHINPGFMSDRFASMEVLERHVTHIFMDAYSYADLRKWHRDILDIETQAVLLKTGAMAKLWGAWIIVRRELPDTMIFASMEEAPNLIHNYRIKTVPVETSDDVDIVRLRSVLKQATDMLVK